MMDLDLVPKAGFQKRCDEVFARATQYATLHGLYLHTTGLSKTILGCDKASEYPSAHPVIFPFLEVCY